MVKLNKELELTPIQLLKFSRQECARLKRKIGEMQSEIDELRYNLTNSQLYKETETLRKENKVLKGKVQSQGAQIKALQGKSKKTIICIVGASGSGKTTLAEHLEKVLDIPQIVSFTTRPMRDGETDGKEHWFVDHCNASKNEMLAYTEFGGYQYWTLRSQFHNKVQTYVIDEKGLLELLAKKSKFIVLTVYVRRNESFLIDNVGSERVERDKNRNVLDISFYDIILDNNGDLREFLDTATERIRGLMKC